MSISREKKDTLKLTALMSFSGVIGRIISIPNAIVIAKFLGPSLLGVLAIINLIRQYAGYTHLGLLQSLSRDVPIAYGRGDKKEARLITDTVYTGFFFASAFAVLALWILFISGVTFKGALDVSTLVLVSLILIANRASSFLRAYIKAEGKFMIIGKLDLILRFVVPGISIPAVIFYKLKGALFAMILTELLSIGYYVVILKRPRFRFYLNLRKTLQLLKTGFMIFVNRISESLFWSVDLMIIAAMMTIRDVGIYTIALAAMKIVEPFSQAVNMIVYRKMMVDSGKYDLAPGKHFRKYTEGLFVLYLMFNSVVIGLGILIYMLIIRTILTRYADSLPIMIILAFGYMIYTSRIFLSFYLNVTDQLKKRLEIILIGLGINAFLDYILIVNGWGIKGVAFACSFSFLFISASIIILSLRQIYGTIQSALFFLFKIIAISAILTLVILVFYEWNVISYAHLPSYYTKILWGTADLMMKGLAFSIACIAAYFLGFKQYQLHQELKPIGSYVWSSVIGRLKVSKNSVVGSKI